MTIKTDPAIQDKLAAYPSHIRRKMEALRDLIVETAKDLGTISTLEETLKWGEPSYIAPKGSTLRMDWKAKSPEQYALYFKCTSQLVPTFKLIFGDQFKYEGNRAILLNLNEDLPKALKTCIGMTLCYHQLKTKPLLGYTKAE